LQENSILIGQLVLKIGEILKMFEILLRKKKKKKEARKDCLKRKFFPFFFLLLSSFSFCYGIWIWILNLGSWILDFTL